MGIDRWKCCSCCDHGMSLGPDSHTDPCKKCQWSTRLQKWIGKVKPRPPVDSHSDAWDDLNAA